MTTTHRDTFPSVTGQPLDRQRWLPEGAPRGVVQLVHGMAEHIGRYDALGQALAQAGYLAVGHTHLGHGPRAELPGFFGDEQGWEHLLADVHRLRLEMERAYPGVPYYLLGHSMGSFLVRCYVKDHGAGLRGAILSGTGWFGAPALKAALGLTGLLCALGQARKPALLVDRLAFGASNRPFAPNRTPFDWLSRDDGEVDAYIADPCCGFPFTARGYQDMFRGLDSLRDLPSLGRIPKELPFLLLSGDQDPVGAMGAGVARVADALRQAGVREVEVRLFPGGRHEMFHETNAADAFDALIAWLGKR